MKGIAIFGGSKLGEWPWQPGRKVWSIAIFGGSDVDFRQAQMEEGVTEVVAVSIFGGNKIIVPPELPVTLSGLSIFGSRELKRAPGKQAPPPAARSLHVNAISIFGGCEITETEK